MARTGKVTAKFVAQLKPPAEGQQITYDGQLDGFGVRITAAGVISFVLNYYNSAGVKRRFTVGRYPEWSVEAAKAEALDLRKMISQGGDPLDRGPVSGDTIADLCREYLAAAEKKKRPTSLRNDRSMIENIIVPALGTLAVSAVTQRDVETLHGSLKPTPYRANRVLALLSVMFSKAITWKLRSDNPCKGVERFPEDKRETWLTAEQLQALDNALTAMRTDSAEAVRLLILTGSRLREVLHAQWSQFDLPRGVWTKPSHATKEKQTEHVPLSVAALEALRRLENRKHSVYLFPGRQTGKPMENIHRAWLAACKRAGLAERYEIQGKRRKMLVRWRPTVRIHDLRHSYASHLVSNGVSLPIIGKLLGHRRPETTQRYAHVSNQAMADATNVFGAVLSRGEAQKKPEKAKASGKPRRASAR